MKATTTYFLVFCIGAISATATAEPPAPPNTLMCIAGELIFSDDFDPATVSDRWFFKAEFALRDGALLRTNVDPTETKRVFLKDPSFHNTIIQFDFKLSGQTTDLRLVTGSGGHYKILGGMKLCSSCLKHCAVITRRVSEEFPRVSSLTRRVTNNSG